VTPLIATAGGGTNAKPMPGQVNLFRSRRQRGQVHLSGSTEFRLHCMVVDTVGAGGCPIIWTQNHSIARRWKGIDSGQCGSGADQLGGEAGRGHRTNERPRAMWQMPDFEAAVFMLAVALMVALFTTVKW
jgi:hypothetical protein